MRKICAALLAAGVMLWAGLPTNAQKKNTNTDKVAAYVNGQPIMETALTRALRRIPADKHDKFRPELLHFLIDNLLIEQHLTRLGIQADPKEVAEKLEKVKEEIKKGGSTYEKVLKELLLTEAELKQQIAAELQWEKYVDSQANDAVLRKLFNANRDVFNGSMVRARHILLTPKKEDAKSDEAEKARLLKLKAQIEAEVAKGLAKLPPGTDKLEREKQRAKLMEDAFAAVAAKESQCPSKSRGGELGFFPRAGAMVEPFASAAFALKPYELSDVVTTQFGHHLILVTERRPGKDITFEEAKPGVLDYFADQLRVSLIEQLRPKAKIVINDPK
ncbi:MAG: hypothetical protein KatS3mg105_0731 [Gemmatales bacterium]|nr:MAG: hypothetical protein KatS3mg105_0731 [Gemmatales bacterium]